MSLATARTSQKFFLYGLSVLAFSLVLGLALAGITGMIVAGIVYTTFLITLHYLTRV